MRFLTEIEQRSTSRTRPPGLALRRLFIVTLPGLGDSACLGFQSESPPPSKASNEVEPATLCGEYRQELNHPRFWGNTTGHTLFTDCDMPLEPANGPQTECEQSSLFPTLRRKYYQGTLTATNKFSKTTVASVSLLHKRTPVYGATHGTRGGRPPVPGYLGRSADDETSFSRGCETIWLMFRPSVEISFRTIGFISM